MAPPIFNPTRFVAEPDFDWALNYIEGNDLPEIDDEMLNGVSQFGDGAFIGYSGEYSINAPNTSISLISDGITEGAITYGSFDHSNLKLFTIGSILSPYTGISCFTNCKNMALSFNIGAIPRIGAYDYNSTNITSFTIPSNVTDIGKGAFNANSRLTDIYCLPTTPPTLPAQSDYPFPSGLIAIHVPTGSLNAYKSATNWSNYSNIMVGDL